ncbi:LysM peptidoglycan-binding domain-containing protein [Sulfitobacter geojensis]|uniref:LysM peptidoglycan-binding domain-containing protein n=1 Tax=Sulfitobacter geojensis TaxID=1342299 RepID=UPI003B8E0292
MDKPADPLTPHVTFDNYVIPQSVQRETKTQNPMPSQTQPGLPVSGMMWAVSAIALLTFVLGVMSTLKFAQTPTEGMTAVTRQQGPDLTSTVAGQSGDAAQVAFLLTQDGIDEARAAARTVMDAGAFQTLRAAALAGAYTITKQDQDGPRRLVLNAPAAEALRKATGDVLRDAISKDTIALPASLNTAEGAADVDMVLFDLIQSSLMDDGSIKGTKAAHDMNRRVFAASDAKTHIANGERVYIVQGGDSLAYLALQFYGHPNQYHRITKANQKLLRAGDGFRTGQQLIIPE